MRKTLYWILVGIFSLIFLISAYVVVDYIIDSRERVEQMELLGDPFDASYPTVTRPVVTTKVPNTGGLLPANPTVPTQPSGTEEATNPTVTDPMPTDPTAPTVTEPDPTEPDPTESAPTEPTPTVPTPTEPTPTLPIPTVPQVPTEPTVPTYPSDPTVLPRFEWYLQRNKDVVGWIRIVLDENASTPYNKYLVNEPILHRPEDKDYYLYRDFEGKYDRYGGGSIYLRESCDMFEPTDVMTIYGHAMYDGTKFGRLNRYYYYKDFFFSHQYIQIWDLYAEHTYQVVCVFKTSGTYGVGFPYHLFDDFADEAEYKEFIEGVRKLAKYDTGIETQYGDTFICLSTCEYTTTNGRLVLVAKRIS